MKKVYLDYAASTPVDSRVEAAMRPYFGKIFGNPHALHRFGQEASRAVFESRRVIASALGADYREIIFTGSATEANNLAIRGILKSYRTYKSYRSYRPRIITSTIEHESVLETCRDLERAGLAEIVYVSVGKDGLVDPHKIGAALNEQTVLVSVMHANNEVGTIQPIAEIAKIIHDFRNSKQVGHPEAKSKDLLRSFAYAQDDNGVYPIFHTDAAQSFQYLDCRADQLGVDLMTLSAHKIYGPKGIGALYVKRQASSVKRQGGDNYGVTPDACILCPVITGSGQEFGLRAGTDNVPYIVGFAKAVEIAEKMRQKESARVGKLRDYFWKQLRAAVYQSHPERKRRISRDSSTSPQNDSRRLQLNSSLKNRLPNNLNIYFPGQKAHELQIKLDLAGIAVSPGAACRSAVAKASYVVAEMGFPIERAAGSLRFSLGRHTTKKEIDYTLDKIRGIML